MDLVDHLDVNKNTTTTTTSNVATGILSVRLRTSSRKIYR